MTFGISPRMHSRLSNPMLSGAGLMTPRPCTVKPPKKKRAGIVPGPHSTMRFNLCRLLRLRLEAAVEGFALLGHVAQKAVRQEALAVFLCQTIAFLNERL